MHWTDEGIVLGAKRHGESNAILELMTREHGRHLGLVRGAAGRRLRGVLQPGNRVGTIWRARLEDHLGHYTVEGLDLAAARFLDFSHALYGVTHLAALCRLLPERDPHPHVYAALERILGELVDARRIAARVARFELQLLCELGFGLDLGRCAATGARAELMYVSRRTGRAISRAAGLPWQDKLLRLPAFLSESEEAAAASAQDIADGFALTGYFLLQHVLEPRGLALPQARAGFVSAVIAAQQDAPAVP